MAHATDALYFFAGSSALRSSQRSAAPCHSTARLSLPVDPLRVVSLARTKPTWKPRVPPKARADSNPAGVRSRNEAAVLHQRPARAHMSFHAIPTCISPSSACTSLRGSPAGARSMGAAVADGHRVARPPRLPASRAPSVANSDTSPAPATTAGLAPSRHTSPTLYRRWPDAPSGDPAPTAASPPAP